MFDGKYLDWNQKRIKGIIDFYGHKFIYLKKVLDLGCGHADMSGVLQRLGADITAVDARQDHLKIAIKKYPGIKTVKSDLDRGWPFHGNNFDIILHLDLLCHLSEHENHLKAVCASANYLILETAVCDHSDADKVIKINENKGIYDLSINGVGTFPTAANIEKILTSCGMEFRRLDNKKFNSGSYKYDWTEGDSAHCDYTKRRIWFCSKNNLKNNNIKTPINDLMPIGMQTQVISDLPVLQNSQISINHNYNSPTFSPPTFSVPENFKVAICISGHLRTFEENYKNTHEYLLSRYNCDVFVHTWNKAGTQRPTDSKLKNFDESELRKKIEDLYHPKKLVIEPPKLFTATPLMERQLLDRRDIPGVLSMFYKIEACNELKKQYEQENNMKYDCVIRFRSDISFAQPIPINKNFNDQYLYLPLYGHFGGLCDQIAWGSSEVMDKYSSVFSNIENLLKEGAPFNPERLVLHHVSSSKLPVYKSHFRFIIKRSNGTILDNMLHERALGFVK